MSRVRDAVIRGEIRPCVLDIKALEKVGATAASSMLAKLEAEGVTVRKGRVWVLA